MTASYCTNCQALAVAQTGCPTCGEPMVDPSNPFVAELLEDEDDRTRRSHDLRKLVAQIAAVIVGFFGLHAYGAAAHVWSPLLSVTHNGSIELRLSLLNISPIVPTVLLLWAVDRLFSKLGPRCHADTLSAIAPAG